jgi:2-iminobutanoate/2-iminopropanoate deaminase
VITDRLAAPADGLPFSDAVVVSGTMAFLAGQGPVADGQLVLGTIAEQAGLTLRNIDQLLARLGVTPASVISCTCYLADLSEIDTFNTIYLEYFGPHRPARTTVQAQMIGGISVEITAVVALPPAGQSGTSQEN